jgi:hypothetical protein
VNPDLIEPFLFRLASREDAQMYSFVYEERPFSLQFSAPPNVGAVRARLSRELNVQDSEIEIHGQSGVLREYDRLVTGEQYQVKQVNRS